MQLFDPNNPNEKKKMMVAAGLGVVALLVLGYVFLGGSSNKTPANQARAAATPAPAKRPITPPTDDSVQDDPSIYQPVVYNGSVPPLSETRRNIFAYYEPTPKPVAVVTPPPPSPTPPPPVTINSLSPSNVYARTADFALQVMGDKFTPALHITIDGRDLPTRFINSQQVATTVPSSTITNPGSRQVMVRSNDGKLYSNTLAFTVATPPLPNYNYVGIIAKPRFNDTAVLQDKGTKEILNVQRGDVLAGRFRVNSISERELVLIDNTLKIRHTIPFSVESSTNPQSRPPIRVSDEEPQL